MPRLQPPRCEPSWRSRLCASWGVHFVVRNIGQAPAREFQLLLNGQEFNAFKHVQNKLPEGKAAVLQPRAESVGIAYEAEDGPIISPMAARLTWKNVQGDLDSYSTTLTF